MLMCAADPRQGLLRDGLSSEGAGDDDFCSDLNEVSISHPVLHHIQGPLPRREQKVGKSQM